MVAAAALRFSFFVGGLSFLFGEKLSEVVINLGTKLAFGSASGK